MKKERHSFTLIELILVIAIVAILAVAMIPVIASARQEARVAKVLLLAEALKSAAQEFNADTGRLPHEFTSSNDPWFHELFANSSFLPIRGQPISGWDGPYIPSGISEDDSPYNSPMAFSVRMLGGGLSAVHLSLSNTPQSDAKKINVILDSNEPGAWNTTGKVLYMADSQSVEIQVLVVKLN